MRPLSVLPRHLAGLLFISSLLTGLPANAASLEQAAPETGSVELAKSSIRVMFLRNKQQLTGVFRRFSGSVQFDPATPAAGHAAFDVEVASFDLGHKALNQAVRERDWLDTDRYPIAHFVSNAIVSAGGGKYSVVGKLTLHGKTLSVVLPISYTQTRTTRIFDGVLPIRRLQFGVGQGAADTSLIADRVVIRFHIVTSDQLMNTDYKGGARE
jgi:polyisoprenoid-binding protein YceI